MDELVIFDLETTGTDTQKDDIVQFAGMKLGSLEEDLNIKIKPGVPISDDAYAVHGISEKDLQNEPKMDEAIHDIANFIYGYPLAGFNITGFDLHILIRDLIMYDYKNIVDDMLSRPIVDALNMERILTPRSLEATFRRYTGKDIEGAHDALSDVKATKAVLLHQMKLSGVKSANAFEDFYREGKKRCDLAGKFYQDEDGVKFGFGKYKDEIVFDHIDYVKWMLRADFSYDTKQFIKNNIL